MIWRYPVATKTLVPLGVELLGVATTSYETSIVRSGVSATDDGPWTASRTLSGQTGCMIDHLPRGKWDIYARSTANPEAPVILLGTVETF